jgi:hypothetical protein
MKKLLALACMVPFVASANVPIMGTVESKCVITTETPGIYGNPTPNKLSTNEVDGGITPVIRFDVAIADYYKAVIATPEDFVTAPALQDVVNFEGEVSVSEVTDAAMAAYDTDKRVYNNVSEFDLSVAGTVWFKATSIASYGYDKSFPAGNYNAVVEATCIAI